MIERLEGHRDHHFRRTLPRRVKNEREALAFIEATGFCAAFTPGLGVPCLREAIEGRREPVLPEHIQHDRALMMVWRLKDELAARQAVYYGKVIAGRPGFIALEFLPAFLRLRIAPGGYRKLYERGLLSQAGKRVMDALTRNGPSETKDLKLGTGHAQPKQRADFDRAMKELQEKFLAVKVEERYEPFTYVWDTVEHRWGDTIAEARALAPRAAAEKLVRHYFAIAAFGHERAIARILGMNLEAVATAARRLEREKLIRRDQRVAGIRESVAVLTEYI